MREAHEDLAPRAGRPRVRQAPLRPMPLPPAPPFPPRPAWGKKLTWARIALALSCLPLIPLGAGEEE